MIRFAYVDFETPEAKVIATTLSEVQLDGRNLLIKDGTSLPVLPRHYRAIISVCLQETALLGDLPKRNRREPRETAKDRVRTLR